MKDYLKENLTEDEKSYVRGIIKKTTNTFMAKYYEISNNELLTIDDKSLENDFESKEYDDFGFINKILDNKILKNISDLKPYTKYEKEKIVRIVDEYVQDSNYGHFIAPLTFNEKLVVFLLYMQNYQVNEVAILLNVDRSSIWRRDKSIKKKFKKLKEEMLNGR